MVEQWAISIKKVEVIDEDDFRDQSSWDAGRAARDARDQRESQRDDHKHTLPSTWQSRTEAKAAADTIEQILAFLRPAINSDISVKVEVIDATRASGSQPHAAAESKSDACSRRFQ